MCNFSIWFFRLPGRQCSTSRARHISFTRFPPGTRSVRSTVELYLETIRLIFYQITLVNQCIGRQLLERNFQDFLSNILLEDLAIFE